MLEHPRTAAVKERVEAILYLATEADEHGIDATRTQHLRSRSALNPILRSSMEQLVSSWGAALTGKGTRHGVIWLYIN